MREFENTIDKNNIDIISTEIPTPPLSFKEKIQASLERYPHLYLVFFTIAGLLLYFFLVRFLLGGVQRDWQQYDRFYNEKEWQTYSATIVQVELGESCPLKNQGSWWQQLWQDKKYGQTILLQYQYQVGEHKYYQKTREREPNCYTQAQWIEKQTQLPQTKLDIYYAKANPDSSRLLLPSSVGKWQTFLSLASHLLLLLICLSPLMWLSYRFYQYRYGNRVA